MQEPVVRLVSWNVSQRAEAWLELKVCTPPIDVALLQEAVPPSDPDSVQTIPSADGRWETSGGRRMFCAAVGRLTDRVKLTPIDPIPISEAKRGDFAVSRPGSLAAAELLLPGEEPIAVVSMYAAWERPRTRGWIYADGSAHRLVSDLSYFIGRQTDHRLIAAGDMNILFGYGDHGSDYWRRRYASVFSRIEGLGLSFVGPQYPNGKQANPWPDELPAESKNVPTYRVHGDRPDSATRQLDFVFASAALEPRLRVSALNSESEWGSSDHCRVLIELF